MKNKSILIILLAIFVVMAASTIYHFMGVKVTVVNKMSDKEIDSFVCFDSAGMIKDFGVLRKKESSSTFLFMSSGQLMKCRIKIANYKADRNDFLTVGYFTEDISSVLISIENESNNTVKVNIIHDALDTKKEVNSIRLESTEPGS